MAIITPYYQKAGITIYCGDCLEVMPQLEPGFDAIIADLPHGTTSCNWDIVIPFEPLWVEYKRLIKENAVIVLTASSPFNYTLYNSNPAWFRYEWIWDKVTPTGFMNCRKMPLKSHEFVLIFYQYLPTYNPQKFLKPYKSSRTGKNFKLKGQDIKAGVYGVLKHGTGFRDSYSYPKSILSMPTGNGQVKSKQPHPTQKPLSLLSYFIQTYTDPNNLILDNTMGSGTTLVAAQNEGRQAVGIEILEKYCKVAVERLQQLSFWSLPVDKSTENNKVKQLILSKLE